MNRKEKDFKNLKRDCDILSKKMYVILRQELFVVLNSSWCIYNFPLHSPYKPLKKAQKSPKKAPKSPEKATSKDEILVKKINYEVLLLKLK